jgi:hypothetical protein
MNPALSSRFWGDTPRPDELATTRAASHVPDREDIRGRSESYLKARAFKSRMILMKT